MSNSGGRRLKQWLIEQIQSAQYSGLQWEDESRTMFRIPWKHAGKQDYNQEVDASIFKVWVSWNLFFFPFLFAFSWGAPAKTLIDIEETFCFMWLKKKLSVFLLPFLSVFLSLLLFCSPSIFPFFLFFWHLTWYIFLLLSLSTGLGCLQRQV